MDDPIKELADAVKAHMELRTAFRARLAVDPEAAALFNMIYAGLVSASAGPAEAARLRILLEEVLTVDLAELRAVVAQAYGIVRAHQHMVMGVLRTAPGEEVEGSTAAQPEGTPGADAVS